MFRLLIAVAGVLLLPSCIYDFYDCAVRGTGPSDCAVMLLDDDTYHVTVHRVVGSAQVKVPESATTLDLKIKSADAVSVYGAPEVVLIENRYPGNERSVPSYGISSEALRHLEITHEDADTRIKVPVDVTPTLESLVFHAATIELGAIIKENLDATRPIALEFDGPIVSLTLIFEIAAYPPNGATLLFIEDLMARLALDDDRRVQTRVETQGDIDVEAWKTALDNERLNVLMR